MWSQDVGQLLVFGVCVVSPTKSMPERLSEFLSIEANGCWNWTGSRNAPSKKDPKGGGYGLMTVGGRTALVHRVVYQIFRGEIPAGKHIDHLCRNRACANPSHLEPVTGLENVRRGAGHGGALQTLRTACKRGHLYSEFAYVDPRRGVKRCRECKNQRRRNARAVGGCE